MEFLVILAPFLMTLFKDCQEKDNMARAQRIKRGGPFVRMRLKQGFRSSGSSRRKAKQQTKETMRDIKSASILEVKKSLDKMCDKCSAMGISTGFDD